MNLATRFTSIAEKSWKTSTTLDFLFTYDVISRNHRNWPALNLTQNARERWKNSYWKHQVLMFYLLGKNSETSQTKKFLYVQGSRLVLFKNELLIYFMDYKHHAVQRFFKSFPYLLFTLIDFVISCGILLTILLLKISSEPLLGFLRCTHILPDLLSMMISTTKTFKAWKNA